MSLSKRNTLAKRKVLATGAALGAALLLAGSNFAATTAKTYPAGKFVVAGQTVGPGEIMDARAIPDMQGKPSLMVTLTPAAAAAIHPVAGATGLPCTLDGKPIGTSPADALASDHILQLSGDFGNYEAAALVARRISGRDPLPDAEGDE